MPVHENPVPKINFEYPLPTGQGSLSCSLYNNNGRLSVSIMSGKNLSGDLVVPSEIPVKGIINASLLLDTEEQSHYDSISSDLIKSFFNDARLSSKIEGVRVSGIASEAFKNSSITSVYVPETVTGIGKSAFEEIGRAHV